MRPVKLPPQLAVLFKRLQKAGVRPVVVGGFVRDALLGVPSKDIDIECFHAATLADVSRALNGLGTVNEAGKSFGVLKLSFSGFDIDLSLPRTEKTTGHGHRAFDVTTFSHFDFTAAARRRDFTVNAIGYDPATKRLLDPFGGIGDLEGHRLRCVDPDTFVEDPLRLLRAVQFAARFELMPEKRLLKLARRMMQDGALRNLPKERIFEEFKKLLLKAKRPSIGFEVMDSMFVTPFFPVLHALHQVPQDPLNHPEGDVFTHTLMALNVMASQRPKDEKKALALMFAVLCHDMAKPQTTRLINKRIKAPGHEKLGVRQAERFLRQLSDESRLLRSVKTLVRLHAEPKRLFGIGAGDGAVRKLSTQVNITELVAVARADFLGRSGSHARCPHCEWLLEKAHKLGVAEHPPAPLLHGRDLIALGLKPSKRFATILEHAYEAQLEGRFSTHEKALEWLTTTLENPTQEKDRI